MKRAAFCGLCALACIETVPWRLRPSPVPWFQIPTEVHQRLDRTKLVWYAPVDRHTTAVDTYQLSLGLPAAHIPALSRGGIYDAERTVGQFPIVYGARRRFTASAFMAEARALGIGYILFRDDAARTAFPAATTVLATDDDRVLAGLPQDPQ